MTRSATFHRPVVDPANGSGALQDEGGFTLVELLVVMALLGMIAVVLFGGLRFSGRVWERTTEIAEMTDTVDAAQGFLRRQLTQALSVSAGGRGVQGTPTMLAFDAPVRPLHGVGGVFTFVMWLDETTPDRRLQIAWAPAREDLAVDAMMRNNALTLLTNVETLGIRYLGANGPQAEPSWLDGWRAGEDLPRAIEFEISPVADAGYSWPKLTITPLIN